MGIVQRQGIKQSIASYFGVVLGAITTLFIVDLAMQENGLLRFIVSTAALALPLVSFGMNTIIIKFYPEFKNKKNNDNGFLGLMISITLIGFLAFILLVFLLKDFIFEYYGQKPEIYLRYIHFAIPIVFFMAMGNVMKFQAANLQRTVVPYILSDLLIKIANPVLILLFVWDLINLDMFMYGLIGLYTTIFILLTAYLNSLNKLNFRLNFAFLNKGRMKQLALFGFFGLLGSLGSAISFQIDVFMIGSMTTLYAVSLYSQSLFIANTIGIPTQAIINIISPLVSKASAENDITTIKDLYQKSSINLFIPGVFLYLLICFNMDDFFSLLPEKNILTQGKYIIIFIGFAKIIDQLTSVNNQIIGYSKFYRFNFYTVLMLGVINISLNLILIPKYQINGAAFASMFSIVTYNIIKFLFIYIKMKIHPFTKNTLNVLVLVLISFGILILLPVTEYAILNIAIRTIILSSIFLFAIFNYNISDEIKQLVNDIFKKIKILK